ncbi:DUF397 domain-containing protein [Streptosporangium sp. NPDC002524]|uniref:DUF397 domain-containing protein n=1 Tax=Streptosporangium sp. NPDC002524 TaxID=3154537 RepID=UPI00331DA9B9
MSVPEPSGEVWRKSSRSGNGQNCVEVAVISKGGNERHDRAYAVRDSKNPNGPRLAFTAGGWRAFIGGVKNGEFDTLT